MEKQVNSHRSQETAGHSGRDAGTGRSHSKPISKKRRKARRQKHIREAAIIFSGLLILGFLFIFLPLYLRPMSSAYDLEITTEDLVLHVGDEADISHAFREVSDNRWLLKLQGRRKDKIRYSSSDEAVVTVDNAGHVKAVGAGKAEITLKVSDLEKKISADSFIKGEALSFEPGTLSLNVSEDAELKTRVSPADAVLFDKISLASSDDSVVRVDQTGHLEALGPGKAFVYAEADGLKGTAEITVYQPMTGISLENVKDNETIVLERGSSRAFPVSFSPKNTTDPRKVSYTLSASSVGDVDKDGVFTAKGPGSVTLTASCNGFTDSVDIDVRVTLTDVQINHEEMALTYPAEDQLSYALVPADTTEGISCTYVSEDPAVVSVDENGLVTAVGGGTAAVVMTVSGFERRCVYTVDVPVTAVNISEGSASLNKGDGHQLEASVFPEFTTEDKDITWISEDPNIAAVDGNGYVTAVNQGETWVHAYHGEIRNSCNIKVVDPNSPEAIAGRLIDYGRQFIGTRYVLHGESLTRGIDCSAFTQQCFATQGISLPRSAIEQVDCGAAVPVDVSQWRRGDLIFYAPQGRVSHVAIYIGNGQILHAAQSVGSVNITAYNYNGNVPCAVRRCF